MHLHLLRCLAVFALVTAAHGQFGLPTRFGTDPGQRGAMFDIVASRSILITAFDLNLWPTTSEIEVFATTGTFVGKETSPFSWRFIDRVPVTPVGGGTETHISLADGIEVGAGQTMGLYITASNGGLMPFTPGSDFGGVAARDASLTILQGAASTYPFAGLTTPTTPGGVSRIWDGRIIYEVTSSITTTFADNNGLAGNMFDIVAARRIKFEEIRVNLLAGNHDIEVWVTKSGSFVGKENDLTAWDYLGGISVLSLGPGTPIEVPFLFGASVFGRRGFYITTTGTNEMRYTNGTNFDGVVVDDGVVQILEGVGKGYPFGTTAGSTVPGQSSRIWNGELTYSLYPVAFFSEDFDDAAGGGTTSPPVGWMQDPHDGSEAAPDWRFRSDGPPSGNGPSADHTDPGTGQFAYVEDSGTTGNAEINLLSPLMTVPVGKGLSFWVNSNDAGTAQNPLAVDVIEHPRGIVHRDIALPVGETAGTWTRFTACLTPFQGPQLQLRFRGRNDNGTFINDVGLDDVVAGAVLGPPGVGQEPRPGLAVLDVNSAGEPRNCAPVSTGLPGPYSAVAHVGGGMDIYIGGEPARPVLFFAGPLNPGLLDLGVIGKLDVGSPGLNDILLIGDGNGTEFLDSLFRTNAVGDIDLTFPAPADLAGLSLGFQVLTFHGGPAAVALSNAVDVTFIP